MALDPTIIGKRLEPSSLTIDAGRLKFFAKATGATDPVYSNEDAARASGHDTLPVPPTFLFNIELESPDPFLWLADLGVDLRMILHGSQRFDYHSVAHAGETLIASPTIADVFSKKGGALEFIVKNTEVTRADKSLVATLASTIVVQNVEVQR